MENSRFSAGSTKRIFNNFYAMTSPKLDKSATNGIPNPQVIHLNVSNSLQQVQHSLTTNSISVEESKQTKTQMVEFNTEKNADSFSLLKNEIGALVKNQAAIENLLKEKEKEKMITELNKIVTNQRKTISDLQLDNESLSHKFQDEIGKRQEVAESMANLWSLVEALKNNSDILKKRFVKFEELETELTDFTSCCSKEVERLENQFVNVNLACEENCTKFRDRISVECQQRESAEVRFRLESEQYEGEISILKSEIDKKHQQLEEVNQTTVILHEKIEAKMKENSAVVDETNLQLAEMNKQMEDLKFQNEDLVIQIANLMGEKEEAQLKNQIDVEKVNLKLQNEKECIRSLEERLQDKDNKLSENEIRFSDFENQITEMETRMEEKDVKISSLLNEQSSLECEIAALKDNRSDMESVILKLKDTIDEKQSSIDGSKLELNESRANFAYAQEAKNDLETQVKRLSEESENFKRDSAYYENLWSGIKFDMKLQEQKLMMTMNSLDEKIRKHKEDYAKLQKELENKETEMRNQKIIDSKAINDSKVLTKKQEDEIKSLKEKNLAQASEIESLKKTSAPNKTKKSLPTLKNTITLNKPRTRSAGPKNRIVKPLTAPKVSKARSTFTPTDDTDDSDLLSQKYQPVVNIRGNPAVRKRVTFSPVISSHSLPADNKFDKLVATPPPSKKTKSISALSETSLNSQKLETCYGTPRIKGTPRLKATPSKLVTETDKQQNSPAIQWREKTPSKMVTETDKQQNSPAIQWRENIDTDDVFKFSSD